MKKAARRGSGSGGAASSGRGLRGVPSGSRGSGELALIEWIRRRLAARPGGRKRSSRFLGPGDDCALLAGGGKGLVAITTDMVLEGVHFSTATMSPGMIGRKSLAVSLSDVAAMGMKPVAAVVAVALPRDCGTAFARGLLDGMTKLARRFGVEIVGGDVTSWPNPPALCVTVLGRGGAGRPVLRSGARAGNDVFVTGPLGGSLLRKHWAFEPLVEDGILLARTFRATAMIDISDGLSTDLAHLCDESDVGATIDEARVPISRAARTLSRRDGRSALDHALADGEDFELLFTAPRARRERILEGKGLSKRPHLIGVIDRKKGMRIRASDGGVRELERRGYEHSWG